MSDEDQGLSPGEDWKERYLRNHAEWRRKTLQKWSDRLDVLFPLGIPESTSWSNVDTIVETLDAVTRYDPEEEDVFVYLFLPDGGTNGVRGVELASEASCIAIRHGEISKYLVRPERLYLYCPDDQPGLAFFWLENAGLHPTGIYSDSYYDKHIQEPLCEIRSGEYRDINVWERGFLTHDESGAEVPLPKPTEQVRRYLSGNLVFVCKSSPYNLRSPKSPKRNFDSGYHERLGLDGLRGLANRLTTE